MGQIECTRIAEDLEAYEIFLPGPDDDSDTRILQVFHQTDAPLELILAFRGVTKQKGYLEADFVIPVNPALDVDRVMELLKELTGISN
jgi:hypothetical protein